MQARQYLLSRDPAAAFVFAREIIGKKLVEAETTLAGMPVEFFPRRAIENIGSVKRELANLAGERVNTSSGLGSAIGILGLEGRVSQQYFLAWRDIPLQWSGVAQRPIPEDWHRIGSRRAGRTNRNATHPINSMLNYGYALLESRVRIAATAVGLDPDIGFLHVEKTHRGMSDRSPLVLDLMEPLRPVVDRAVLGLVFAEKTLHAQDFVIEHNGVCRLHHQFSRLVVQKVDTELGDRPLMLAREVVQWIMRREV